MANSPKKYTLAMNLLHKLSRNIKENFVFSPLSIGTAFAILCAGTKGETQQELLDFLGHTDTDSLHESYGQMIANEELPFRIANRCLSNSGYSPEETLRKFFEATYKALVESVDFVKDGRKLETQMDEWISEKTDKMIQNLIPPGTFKPDTIFVILNAVFFKGTWMKDFEVLPFEQTFTQRTGSEVQKAFMRTSSKDIKYTATEHLRVAKIPYKEAGCYMVVAIPQDGNKFIDEVISGTSADQMHTIIEELNTTHSPKVNLTMPKFKIEHTFEGLVSSMVDLGVKKIFSSSESDFSLLFPNSSGLFVSDVIHKAAIEVDEKGTKAAAATAVVMYMTSCMSYVEEIDLILDRPFYFAIHESLNHTATFQGICNSL